MSKRLYQTALNVTVLITGLGFFVDTFDFFLFLSMRVPSLTELGLSPDAITKTGLIILDVSIFGALIGSLFWGVLGDKIGRKKALIGSILIYSAGMTANAFVQDQVIYGIVRFIIGFGIAGELGLGATLVAETIQTSKRTFALTFFTVMGVLGVAAAALSLEFVSWRTSCLIGGGLGFVLLLLRSLLYESDLFIEKAAEDIKRGSLRELFLMPRNLHKFVCCVLILVPNYFVTGYLLALSPEISKVIDVHGIVKANIALALYFSTSALGDLWGAWLSERLKSRRLVALIFIACNGILALIYLQNLHLSLTQFYTLCAFFGFFNLWAISGTIVVEQFPTWLRATASTASLNFSRGAVILIHTFFLTFKPTLGIIHASYAMGAAIFALGLFSAWRLSESYGKPLETVI